MLNCFGNNAITCAFDCKDGELDDALELVSSDCSSNDELCAVSACCPQCASAAGAYKECLLDGNCDTTCPDVVPTEDDDFSSPECANEGTAYKGCLIENLLVCGPSCSQGEDDDNVGGSDELSCEDIPETCDDLECCPMCIPAGKVFIACEAKLRGCSDDCSDIAPAAPSPIAPFTFPPFTFASPVVAPSTPAPQTPPTYDKNGKKNGKKNDKQNDKKNDKKNDNIRRS